MKWIVLVISVVLAVVLLFSFVALSIYQKFGWETIKYRHVVPLPEGFSVDCFDTHPEMVACEVLFKLGVYPEVNTAFQSKGDFHVRVSMYTTRERQVSVIMNSLQVLKSDGSSIYSMADQGIVVNIDQEKGGSLSSDHLLGEYDGPYILDFRSRRINEITVLLDVEVQDESGACERRTLKWDFYREVQRGLF